MKKIALALIISILTPLFTNAAVTFPVNGGTGISTKPTYGQVLVGNSGGTYTLTATSSLGISGGGSGLTSLNGQTGSTQTFATTSATTGFSFNSSSNVHTLNLPPSSATATGTMAGFDFQKLQNLYNVKQFGATGNGTTDDCTSVQKAIDTATSTGGGTIYFPAGTYFIDCAFTEVPGARSGYNFSQLKLPSRNLSTQSSMSIQFLGEQPPAPNTNWTNETQPLSTGGAIIKSTKVGAQPWYSIIGTPGPSGATWEHNAIILYIKNLTFRTYDNPTITPLNLAWVGQVVVENVLIDTGTVLSSVSQNTNLSTGLVMPYVNNWTVARAINVDSIGYSNAFSFSEHTDADDVRAWLCTNAFALPGSYHDMHVNKSLAVGCTNGIVALGVAGPLTQSLTWDNYAVEHTALTGGRSWTTTVYDIKDASNLLKGKVSFSGVTSNVGPDTAILKTGGANLQLYNLNTNTTNFIYSTALTASSSNVLYASTTATSATSLCILTDCRTVWPSAGGGAYPFTQATNFGATNQATTGVAWFQNGFNASSTSNFVNGSFSGNVGVGTASPSVKMEVSGVTPSLGVIDTGGLNELYYGTNFTFGGGVTHYGTLSINRDPGTGVFKNTIRPAAQINLESTISNSEIAFFTTTTNNATPIERMRVKGNGSVTYGNTTSSGSVSPINISLGGTFGTNAAGSIANSKLDLYNDGVSRYGMGVSSGSLLEFIAPSSAGHAFYVNGGTLSLSLPSTGNIGIGTSTPYAKLSVVGEGVFRNLTATSTTSTTTIAGPLKLGSTGTSATQGNATLVGGTVTVTTGAAVSTGYVHLTRKTLGGVIGTESYTITNGSFTINSDNALDTSTFTWVVTQ